MNKQELDKLKPVRDYGNKFLDCVCESCRAKIEPYFKKHLLGVMVRPKRHQQRMAAMLCSKCKANLTKRARQVR